METFGKQMVADAPRANPFFHRGPIRDPAYFYGRQHETRLMLDLVRNGQSVSVLGQRRIGKSSFVLHASHPAVLHTHGLHPEQYLLHLRGLPGPRRPDGGRALRVVASEPCQGIARTRAEWDESGGDGERQVLCDLEADLAKAIQAGFRPVFAFDEFEALAASRNLTPDFFSSLRRIVTGYPVAIVTVTKDPLTMLAYAHQSVLSSPFFNIFQPLSLGLFTAEDAVAMLQGLAARGGLRFTQATLDFLFDLAGGHPLLLQLAGFHAFEALEGGAHDLSVADRQSVRERFWNTASQHFEYYWNHLDEEARYALATLPLISDQQIVLWRRWPGRV